MDPRIGWRLVNRSRRCAQVFAAVQAATDAPSRFAAAGRSWNSRVMDTIDQQREGPSRVRPENQPYRKLAELSPTPQCVCVDGKLVFANAAFLALLRAANNEIVMGRAPEEFVPQSRREAFRNRV